MDVDKDSVQNLDILPCWICQYGSLKEAFAQISIYLLIMAHYIWNIMPGSANFEIYKQTISSQAFS